MSNENQIAISQSKRVYNPATLNHFTLSNLQPTATAYSKRLDDFLTESIKEPSEVESSYVRIVDVGFAQEIHINENQSIEIWSWNISPETRKLFHKLIVRFPDGSYFTREGTPVEVSPGFTLYNKWTVYNIGKGIGFFDFSCEVWEEVFPSTMVKHDEKVDRYWATFYKPQGVSDNYYCDDMWHHPSNSMILDYALLVAGGSTSPREAVAELMNFVYYYVAVDPEYRERTSDIMILAEKRGDCNDFADLYTGIARSLNIPTRIALGNAFKTSSGGEDNVCGVYCRLVKRAWAHAWAESYYNGAFHHVDPSWNIMEYPRIYINSSSDIHSIHASAYIECADNYLDSCLWTQDAERCLNGFVDVTCSTDGGYDTMYYCPSDADNDGICDSFDPDKDNDGTPNAFDPEPCGATGLGFYDIPSLFQHNNFHVVGDTAKCTDVLGTANMSWGYGNRDIIRPEGKTDQILTQLEHDYYNLIIVGGPAVNPLAEEFDNTFGITYAYVENVSFEIFAEGKSIHLDLGAYPSQDICIVYLGWQNNRPILLIWGYGWEGTYAGSVFMSYPHVWNAYAQEHLLLLRWRDTNSNGFIEFTEIHPENIPEVPVTPPSPGTPQLAYPVFGNIPFLFGGYTFHVVGDTAKCTDVLGTANMSWAFGNTDISRPEGKTDLLLTVNEHNAGNLIIVGGPAVNPLADEFDNYFGITYTYVENVSFDIFAEGKSIHLDITSYPSQDLCIVYVGRHNNRNILLIWGYGWEGTYAGSVFMSNPTNWTFYRNNYLLFLRWRDLNADGYIQINEIFIEAVK